jgi:hypothetical protein
MFEKINGRETSENFMIARCAFDFEVEKREISSTLTDNFSCPFYCFEI